MATIFRIECAICHERVVTAPAKNGKPARYDHPPGIKRDHEVERVTSIKVAERV